METILNDEAEIRLDFNIEGKAFLEGKGRVNTYSNKTNFNKEVLAKDKDDSPFLFGGEIEMAIIAEIKLINKYESWFWGDIETKIEAGAKAITDSGILVIWATFVFPFLFFLVALISKFHKNGKIAESVYAILFISIAFTWIIGLVSMVTTLFFGVSGIKMYFIWLLVFVSSLIFLAMNFNLIFKNYINK